MKTVRKFSGVLTTLILIITLTSSVYALTITLENGRMVLRANTGDTLEKSVGVVNINDEKINVEVSASGDLEKYINIKDKKFEMQPGERKDIRFTVKVAKEGTTESKINIKFSSQSEKNGVALSSEIIIIAGKGEDVADIEEDNNPTNPLSDITGKVINKDNFNPVTIFAITTIILFLVLIALLILSKRSFKGGLKEEIKGVEEIKPKKRVQK